MKSLLILAAALLSSQAFAFGAFTGKYVCVTDKSAKVRISAILPFSEAEADGFEFTEGGVVNINDNPQSAKLISRNNENTLARSPSMFTIQADDNTKLGFIIRTKVNGQRLTVVQTDPSLDIGVEVILPNGQSQGVQNINCDMIRDLQ